MSMRIRIVSDTISLDELRYVAEEFYGSMVKGAVDVERGIIAFGGEYHIDANNVLIENGSLQQHVWGFNVNLDRPREEWLEYTALINIRPVNGNVDIEIEDAMLRDRIREIVNARIL